MGRASMSERTESRGIAKGRLPIRVMHLVYRFGVGGMELGVTKLVNSLDGERVCSSICSSCPGDDLKTQLRPGVRLFELNRRDGNDPLFVAQLYRLLRRERPDVLHTHSWGTLLEGLIAARLAGVPTIVHGEHGTLQTRGRNIRVQRWTWGRVDRLLSVSSRLAERISHQIGFPLDRIQVIRNGVDLDRFTPRDSSSAKRALGLNPDELLIGTVGRLVPVKDQTTLIDALGILRDRGVPFSAAIAGTGPLRDQLARHAQALQLPQIHLLGNRHDIESVLNAYDIFVLSSRSEGLSNTIQEAMASGLPVIATRVGGADELVQEHETGLLVPPKDPVAMADALESLARDVGRRQQLAIAGRNRAATYFGLERMVRAYEHLYLGLAHGQPSPLSEPQPNET